MRVCAGLSIKARYASMCAANFTQQKVLCTPTHRLYRLCWGYAALVRGVLTCTGHARARSARTHSAIMHVEAVVEVMAARSMCVCVRAVRKGGGNWYSVLMMVRRVSPAACYASSSQPLMTCTSAPKGAGSLD